MTEREQCVRELRALEHRYVGDVALGIKFARACLNSKAAASFLATEASDTLRQQIAEAIHRVECSCSQPDSPTCLAADFIAAADAVVAVLTPNAKESTDV